MFGTIFCSLLLAIWVREASECLVPLAAASWVLQPIPGSLYMLHPIAQLSPRQPVNNMLTAMGRACALTQAIVVPQSIQIPWSKPARSQTPLPDSLMCCLQACPKHHNLHQLGIRQCTMAAPEASAAGEQHQLDPGRRLWHPAGSPADLRFSGTFLPCGVEQTRKSSQLACSETLVCTFGSTCSIITCCQG